MLIRKPVDTVLSLASEAVPVTGFGRDWIIDWRWLSTEGFSTEGDDDTPLPSECSLIDCAPWAKPKRPRHA